jgi:hypothetical protein
MKKTLRSVARKLVHQTVRAALALLPRALRFAVYRAMVDCDPQPDPRLTLKIADTQDELEACFGLLHDAYVSAGFMVPQPSGLRVTIYHALPTTTTLCAKWDGQVVGTISMIREGVFGFPLQSVFNLSGLRSRSGNIAEISALAIAPAFRKTGGKILFPLMKFMNEYGLEYFDTRHIVIAVNPSKIEMYESLLFFERLQAAAIENYDFANGAPAVGASLDLVEAVAVLKRVYGHKPERKNLWRYFTQHRLPNIQTPPRRFFTTNDPVLTPKMIDYFFNQRSDVFATLDDRKRLLLRSIYDHQAYDAVLPLPLQDARIVLPLRQHQRFSIRCPARLVVSSYGGGLRYFLQVIEMSLHGFQAESATLLPEGLWGRVEIHLGVNESACVQARPVRRQQISGAVCYSFEVPDPDPAWRRCVQALHSAHTRDDLVLPEAERWPSLRSQAA